MANSKRRWMQFSLRTAFIIVTLLCVALGMWVVPADPREHLILIALVGPLAEVRSVGGHKRTAPR